MKNIINYILFVYMLLFSIPSQAYHTEIYMNPTLGLSMRGPSYWYLEMKDNPSQNAKFFFKNPHLFALFSKYNFEQATTWPSPLGSLIFAYVFPPEIRSASMIINQLYSKSRNDPGIDIIEPPHEVKWGNQSWLVMASHYKIKNTLLYHVTYITLYSKGSIQIEAKTTESDDAQFRRIADTFISKIIYDNNAGSLQLKTTNEYFPYRKN